MDRTPDAITDEARFFLEPAHTRQRQYEALRAYFAEGLPSAEAARRFGYQPGSFRILCWRFRHAMDREFFRDIPHGFKSQPRKNAVRELVVSMRKRNLSVYDIRDELERSGKDRLSVTEIQSCSRGRLLASAAPARRGTAQPTSANSRAIGDVRMFSLQPGEFSTHAGGLFLLLPLLARLDLDALVERSGFPGTKMIPAAHAVRAALLLKLLGKSRRSHVMDLVFDPGVALAAGLNAIPKATFMSQYSSRLGRKALVRLLGAWVEKLREENLVDASSFDLDFHSISYFGEDPSSRSTRPAAQSAAQGRPRLSGTRCRWQRLLLLERRHAQGRRGG